MLKNNRPIFTLTLTETNTHSHIHKRAAVPSNFQQSVWNIKRLLLYAVRAEDRKQHQPWAPGETQQPPTDSAVLTHTYTHIYTPTFVHSKLHNISAHTIAHSWHCDKGIKTYIQNVYIELWAKELQLPFMFFYSVTGISFLSSTFLLFHCYILLKSPF